MWISQVSEEWERKIKEVNLCVVWFFFGFFSFGCCFVQISLESFGFCECSLWLLLRGF